MEIHIRFSWPRKKIESRWFSAKAGNCCFPALALAVSVQFASPGSYPCVYLLSLLNSYPQALR